MKKLVWGALVLVIIALDRPFSGDAAADAKAVMRAIRNGHLYVAIAGVAEPASFDFSAANERGTVHAGDEIAGLHAGGAGGRVGHHAGHAPIGGGFVETESGAAAGLRRYRFWRYTVKRHAAVFLIEGHTDANGSDAANLDLSKRRSAAVRDVLAGRFKIAGDRLVADGKGERVPKATNDTAEGRAQNRRVELTRQ